MRGRGRGTVGACCAHVPEVDVLEAGGGANFVVVCAQAREIEEGASAFLLRRGRMRADLRGRAGERPRMRGRASDPGCACVRDRSRSLEIVITCCGGGGALGRQMPRGRLPLQKESTSSEVKAGAWKVSRSNSAPHGRRESSVGAKATSRANLALITAFRTATKPSNSALTPCGSRSVSMNPIVVSTAGSSLTHSAEACLCRSIAPSVKCSVSARSMAEACADGACGSARRRCVTTFASAAEWSPVARAIRTPLNSKGSSSCSRTLALRIISVPSDARFSTRVFHASSRRSSRARPTSLPSSAAEAPPV